MSDQASDTMSDRMSDTLSDASFFTTPDAPEVQFLESFQEGAIGSPSHLCQFRGCQPSDQKRPTQTNDTIFMSIKDIKWATNNRGM